jgi:hypothetical protein
VLVLNGTEGETLVSIAPTFSHDDDAIFQHWEEQSGVRVCVRDDNQIRASLNLSVVQDAIFSS